MADKQVFYANNLNEVFFQKKSIKNLEIVGGCSGIDELPEYSLSVRFIKELSVVDKRETYIDFGPAATLSEIIEIGDEYLPEVFYKAVSSVANPLVRNLATIGGNICNKKWNHTLVAPLLAMDAFVEISKPRTKGLINESQFVQFSKFDEVPEDFVLTKIRVPVEEWDFQIFKKFGSSQTIDETSASFVFLLKSQKNQIVDLRVAFAGPFRMRTRDLEIHLIGSSLPLNESQIKEFVTFASVFYDEHAFQHNPKPILKQQFLNVLKFSLEQLT